MSELGFTSPREMAAALFIIGGLIFFIGCCQLINLLSFLTVVEQLLGFDVLK